MRIDEGRLDSADPLDPDFVTSLADTASDPFANVYGWVWELLEETPQSLPATTLTRYINSSVRFLRATWDCLPAYADLDQNDVDAMDEALGHLVAARYRAKHPKKARGEVLEVQEADEIRRYAAPKMPASALETDWMETAYLTLQQVSCIADVLVGIRAVSLFQTAGKRSEQAKRGLHTRSLNPLFTVLADEWDTERHLLYNSLYGSAFGPF